MKIYVHKTGVMHAISTAMARGFTDYVSGQVPPERVQILADKFRRLYGTEWSSARRSRAKATGAGTAQLFIHPSYTGAGFDWWLVVSPGPHLARQEEKIIDGLAADTRLTVQGQYEAVRLPGRPSRPTDKYPKPEKGKATPSWTWRMTPGNFADWRANIETAIRHRQDTKEIKTLLLTLRQLPGFRGIRAQADELDWLAKQEWARIKSEPYESLGVKLAKPGYIRFKTFPKVELEFVRQRLLDGKSPYPIEMKEGWKRAEKNDELERA